MIHEFTSLFSPKVYKFCRFAQEGLPRKQAFVDISVFLWLRKQQPRFAKGQPKGYFQMQELDRTAEVIVPMNEVWKKLNANMRQYVPLHGNMGQPLLFVSCAEKDSLCGTVMMGLKLTCLDQCHGVRWHGTSSLQGWCKRIVVFRFSQESLPTEAGLCRHQCFSAVAQATSQIRPRPAQGLFSIERTS